MIATTIINSISVNPERNPQGFPLQNGIAHVSLDAIGFCNHRMRQVQHFSQSEDPSNFGSHVSGAPLYGVSAPLRPKPHISVRANSVLGGLHHECFLAPTGASVSICA